MKTLKRTPLIILLVIVFQLTVNAQNDTIDIGKKELLMKNLPEGTDQYLIYAIKGKKISTSLISSRTVKYDKFNNRDVVIVSHLIGGPVKKRSQEVYSINDAANFEPIYHYRKAGNGKIEAFNFSKKQMHGADTVTNNSQKTFRMPIKTPTLNWELDLEIFKTLDYKKGKTFVINFYHPGSKNTPQFYEYKIVREETIQGLNGTIDCWVMMIDHGITNGIRSFQTFWIDKKSKAIIKQLEIYGKTKVYKLKIGALI